MADLPVITDTSPLIKLAGVGQLDLLPQLYGDIWVPTAVAHEFAAGATPGDPDLTQQPWITIQPIAVIPQLTSVRGLGLGESEAISLAVAAHARLILLDDRLGRREAQRLGLPVAGTLAVLLRAKHMQLIPEVGPIVDRMIAQGRRISRELRDQLLRDAGELPSGP